jgi:hypothetical protein
LIFSERQPEIWGVIGLFSQILGLNPEALTIVVLAHELAHAYTHRTADIDGKFWDSAGATLP